MRTRTPELSRMSLTSATDTEVMAWTGARLQALRETRGLTSSEAAQQAGLSRRTVYRAERGLNPTLLTIVRLLRLYGRLEALESFLPEPEVSPMALIEQDDRRRARRTRRRGDL